MHSIPCWWAKPSHNFSVILLIINTFFLTISAFHNHTIHQHFIYNFTTWSKWPKLRMLRSCLTKHNHLIAMVTILAPVSFILLILAAHFSFATNTTESITSSPKRAITKLIHRHSILSPHYNPNHTTVDLTKELVRISSARIDYLSTKIYGRHTRLNDSLIEISPTSDPLLMVSFWLGTPPVPQLAVLDTGSRLLWVQCIQCERCSPQTGPMFDPKKSVSYTNLTARRNGILCELAPGYERSQNNQCEYAQGYAKGPFSKGILAFEQLSFNDLDGGIYVVPRRIVFGCCHEITNNVYFPDRQVTGVFGLSDTIPSVASQLGYKFSYCLGNLYDPHYSYNQLVIGEEAVMEGDSTPLLSTIYNHYFISLEEISIGDKRLVIEGIGKGKGTPTLIDSGSALTWLDDKEYIPLENEVASYLDAFLVRNTSEKDLCYHGIMSQDLVGFPGVTFYFANEVELVLDIASMFYQAREDLLCMAVRQSSKYKRNNMSLIGLLAQQNYNVGYDIIGKNLFLLRIDCQLLEE